MCCDRVDPYFDLALSSCFNQSFQDFTTVLVCNGPNRHLVEARAHYLYGHDKRLLTLSTPVSGLTFSLNLGLSSITSPYLARMDADDISHYDRLKKQLSFLRSNAQISVLGTSFCIIDSAGDYVENVIPALSHSVIARQFLWSNPICHPSVVMRSKLIQEIGGYMGGPKAEDYDLWLRLLTQADCHFANLPDSLLSYRQLGRDCTRRSIQAYSSVAASRLSAFSMGKGICWLPASAVALLQSKLASYNFMRLHSNL